MGGGAHWPHPEIHETPVLKNSSKRRNLIIYKTIIVGYKEIDIDNLFNLEESLNYNKISSH